MALRQDQTDNAIHVFENFASGDTQHPEACSLKVDLAEGVDVRSIAALMRLAIDLDQQPS